jgi:hypothetical protein
MSVCAKIIVDGGTSDEAYANICVHIITFLRYTKLMVYGMTYKWDCGNAEIAVPLQPESFIYKQLKG